VSDARPSPVRARLSLAAVGVACFGVAGCATWAALAAHHDHVGGLSIALGVAAVASGLGVARIRANFEISASFIVYMLAAAFLGPASAFVAAVVAEVAATRVIPTRRQAFAFNILGNGLPALLAGAAIQGIAPHDHRAVAFYLVLAALSLAVLLLGFVIIAPLYIALDGDRDLWSPRSFVKHLPTVLINVPLAVAGAAVYVELGVAGIAFALVAVFAFAYMAHLLDRARTRAEAHAALSWGVLGGLLRALDMRDQRAARHAAAVAGFARDIAKAVGMSTEACELAHTAGLLHDIGAFALSDRVYERGRTLNEEDWTAIQRHPELGADLLKDLGMYGPVAEIILAHHERVDGRGYPKGLPADEIPEIAKIISVAEVYDTLTASDTYRTQMSSFEALRELRRVAGSQLDARYVEVLAELLAGAGVEYRHADKADFDAELDIERRINEAGAGGSDAAVHPNSGLSAS
jgi:putative nucleotidyltransferase with HDIG domain